MESLGSGISENWIQIPATPAPYCPCDLGPNISIICIGRLRHQFHRVVGRLNEMIEVKDALHVLLIIMMYFVLIIYYYINSAFHAGAMPWSSIQ